MQDTDKRFDLIICIGSSQAIGGSLQLFELTQKLLKPKGKILFGEIVWKAQPSQDFLKFLNCKEQDQMYSTQLFEVARNCGLSIEKSASCLDSDFEAYENKLKSSIDAWVIGNADHHMTEQLVKRSEAWADAREKWARSAFGFEVFTAGRS